MWHELIWHSWIYALLKSASHTNLQEIFISQNIFDAYNLYEVPIKLGLENSENNPFPSSRATMDGHSNNMCAELSPGDML